MKTFLVSTLFLVLASCARFSDGFPATRFTETIAYTTMSTSKDSELSGDVQSTFDDPPCIDKMGQHDCTFEIIFNFACENENMAQECRFSCSLC